MKRRIGILTLPPQINYGGILQAYALKTTLENMGFEVDILERLNDKPTVLRIIGSWVKTVIFKTLNRDREFTYWISNDEFKAISENTRYFTNQYLCKKTFYSSQDLGKYINLQEYYALIVGSDQVWRPEYVSNIFDYFFDFKISANTKKIAYAASLGVPHWPFSTSQSKRIKKLCSKFTAMSGREDSVSTLFEENIKVNNILHVLDPTLLLSVEKYIALFEKEHELESSGTLFTYILDPNLDKESLIKYYERELDLTRFSTQPEVMDFNKLNREPINKFIYPDVTKWLRSFHDAKFVITDSFHGCVFSIIFNKPFLVLTNKSKGQARFTSLLKMFELLDRLDNVSVKNAYNIDWQKVNQIRKNEVEKSLIFLEQNLI